MIKINWKYIKIHGNKSNYKINESGEVINIITGHKLARYIKDGYLFVSLMHDGIELHYNLAKLMLKIFKPKEKGDMILFSDGDRSNVSIQNISYVNSEDFYMKRFATAFIDIGNDTYRFKDSDINDEVWKFISVEIDDKQIETTYILSNYGRVFNIKTFMMLKVNTTSSRYPRISISINHHHKMLTIHQEVAKLFVYNPDPINKIYVHHKNNNKQDPKYTNLEWVTPSENTQHAIEDGKQPCGEKSPNSTITEDTAIKIICMLKNGYRVNDIVSELDVSRSVVTKIKRGISWKHLTNGEPILNGHEVPYTLEEISSMINMIRNGASYYDIHDKYGILRTTYYRYRDSIIESNKLDDNIKVDVINQYKAGESIKDIVINTNLKRDTIIDILYDFI